MCNCTSWMRHLAQARNPYSPPWLWIPGSRGACHRAALCADPLARPGMTVYISLAAAWLLADLRDYRHPAGKIRNGFAGAAETIGAGTHDEHMAHRRDHGCVVGACCRTW